MFDVITLGHILYDMRCYVDDFPKPDKTSFVKGKIKHSIGGSATNVACNLAKLGRKTCLISKIGLDENGKYLIEELRKLGVCEDYVLVNKEKQTGVAMLIINKQGEPILVEMIGANEPILPKEISKEAIENSKHLHMSGTNLEALEAASKIAKKLRKTISFDPGRTKSQFGFKKLKKIFYRCSIIFFNEAEVCRVIGKESFEESLEEIRKKLKDKIIVIKRGKNPTLLFSPRKNFSVSTIKVKVIDTIGAGDAFTAGFLHKFLSRKSLEECVKFANACGALKTMNEGAAGLPFKEEIEKFYKKKKKLMKVEKL